MIGSKMATGYTRNDTLNNIANGNIIDANDLDGEFDAVQAAFDVTTGHNHDGTVGGGAPVEVIGPAQDIVVTATVLRPKTDNAVDLGTSTLEFKNLYLDGTAQVDTLQVDESATITANLTVNGNTTLGNADTDTVTLTAQVATSVVPSVDNAVDLGSSTKEWRDLYVDGIANIDSLVADTADINGGTIDGATIATSDITVGSGKTLNVSAGTLTLANDQISGDKVEGGTINAITINTLGSTTGNITTVNATTVDTTNLEVTALKAKDGTAAATIANSTGVVTIPSSVLTSTTISGGSISGITDLAVADGGTGASDAATARTNLGVAIGTNVQAYDAGLQSIAGLTTTADRMIYTTASDVYAVTPLTTAGRALLDDADASAQRTTLGLGTISTQAANNVAVTGGTINGTTIGATTPSTIAGTTGSFSGDLTIADKIVHSGDTNTAIRFPADDTVTVETNGAERMRIDSAGNVGIGSSAPSGKLEVNTSSGAGAYFTRTAGDNGVLNSALNITTLASIPQIGGSGGIIFAAGTVGTAANAVPERMRITSAGKVGIGTSVPTEALHVAGQYRQLNKKVFVVSIGAVNDGSTIQIDITSDEPTQFYIECKAMGYRSASGANYAVHTLHKGLNSTNTLFGPVSSTLFANNITATALSRVDASTIRLSIANSSGNSYNAGNVVELEIISKGFSAQVDPSVTVSVV
jgi:hypothetical protein